MWLIGLFFTQVTESPWKIVSVAALKVGDPLLVKLKTERDKT